MNETQSLKNKKPIDILVVEDNMPDFLLLKEMLDDGHLKLGNVFHARELKEIFAINKAFQFDIILLDLTLPDSSGIQSVISLTHEMPQVPLIVLSGLNSIDVAVESISRGAQDYLVKGDFDEVLLAKSIQYSIERKKTQALIESNNERYSLINKATHDTLWEWNFKTEKGRWGDGFVSIFGYNDLQKNFDENWVEKFVHPSDRARVIKKRKFYIDNRVDKWMDQYRFLDASGVYRFVFDRAFILYDNKSLPKRMIGAMADITERKILEQEIETQTISHQKLITEVTIEAQEKERNQLGRELHDNINQLLTTVKLYIGMLQTGRESTNADALLGKSNDYITAVIEEIRQLSHSLVDPTLTDEGLVESLKHLAEEIEMTTNLKIRVISQIKEMPELDKKKELMIYRVVQEQMSNIRKHARAHHVDIHVSQQNHSILLEVKDDGVGFDPKEMRRGIGLQNIKSRVEFYNGNMKIISSAGKGTQLVLTIPQQPPNKPL